MRSLATKTGNLAPCVSHMDPSFQDQEGWRSVCGVSVTIVIRCTLSYQTLYTFILVCDVQVLAYKATQFPPQCPLLQGT
jgi:hypothetical protein